MLSSSVDSLHLQTQAVSVSHSVVRFTLNRQPDNYATTIIWSTVEVGVGIFCACLPVLRPILNALYSILTRQSSDSTCLPRNQPRSRRDTLRMKSYHSTDALEDRAPFAQVETSVTRNSQGAEREAAEFGGNGITVSTSINQKVVGIHE